MQLRPYQAKIKQEIYDAWRTHDNVAAVLPTGAGKTVMFSSILHEHQGASCAIAHRQELVGQMSLSLAKFGLEHRVIAPKNVIRMIGNLHVSELGRNFCNPTAPCAVAGVQTLIRRQRQLKRWSYQVTKWITDECHHIIRDNSWGKAVRMFPNAQGLGVTATLCRSDGKGLGRHADGVFDTFVQGPSARELMNMGYLVDYRIFAPESDLDLEGIAMAADGDYNKKQLKTRARQSHIVGDVVQHYLRIAPGKLGVTFATDIETATDITEKYNAAGVPAELITGKTPDNERIATFRRFRNREVLQIVNVDICGEGVDIPALEVVSMARPTASYGLYTQQFGRALRILLGKSHAIIIDHVGNVMRHGLPDKQRVWTLDRRERRAAGKKDPDVIPVRTCKKCMGVYEAIYIICPYCGFQHVPAGRTLPEQVDGDLLELDPATLAAMRGETARIDAPASEVRDRMMRAGASAKVYNSAAKQHTLRQEAQGQLRESIALWAGYQRAMGRPDSESYRRFYFRYGTDVESAKVLGRREAMAMTHLISEEILKMRGMV